MQLRLYARYNDLKTIVADEEDEFLAKAISFENLTYIYETEGVHHGQHPIFVYFSFTISLPFLVVVFFAVVMRGSRVQIRLKLTDRKWHPTFASLIVIGLCFCIFVVGLDFCALAWAHEWRDAKNDHGPQSTWIDENNQTHRIHSSIAFNALYATIAIDSGAALFAFISFIGYCYAGHYRHDSTFCERILKLFFKYCFRCTFRSKGHVGVENAEERIMWLLTTTTFAPLICFSTHIGYIILAWLADPSHGGAVLIIYTLSFFYFHIVFKQIYHIFKDKLMTRKVGMKKPRYLGGEDCCNCLSCCNCFDCKATEWQYQLAPKETDNSEMIDVLDTAAEEHEKHESNHIEDDNTTQHTFSYSALFWLFGIGLFLGGFYVYAISAFTTLPLLGVIEDTPLYMLNLFHISVLIVSFFLTYKYFMAEAPIERELLRNIVENVKYYRNMNRNLKCSLKPRRATEVEKAAAVFGALMYNNMHDGLHTAHHNTLPTGGTTPTTATGGTPPAAATGGTPPAAATGGITPTPTTGGTPPAAATGGITPAAATGGITPAAATGGITPAAATGGITPAAATGGITPAAATGGITPAAATGGITPTPTTGGMPPAAATGGITPAAATGGMPPAAATGGMPPAAATGGITPAAATGGITPAAATGGMPPAAATGGITPAAATGGMPPAAATGGMPPAAATGGITPAAATGGTPPAATTSPTGAKFLHDEPVPKNVTVLDLDFLTVTKTNLSTEQHETTGLPNPNPTTV